MTLPTATADAPPARRTVIAPGPLLAALVAVGWLLLNVPELGYFLLDADGGLFMQGAHDWRRFGAMPQVDVYSSYGPLMYAGRLVLQQVLGERLIAEVASSLVGYGLGFGLFFAATRGFSQSRLASWILLVVALVCLPRYYKWAVVLVPAATAWVALRVLAPDSGRGAAVAAGATLALAWLFRHDYLAYSTAVLGVAWLVRAKRDATFWRHLPAAAVVAAAVAGPWLVVLATRRGLGSYLRELAGVTGSHAVGLGLPHPLLTWTSTSTSLLFLAVYLMPVVIAWAAVASWRRGAPDTGVYWVAAVLAAAHLPQSMHRADVGHLLQVVPPCLIGLGVVARAHPRRAAGLPLVAAALASASVALLLALGALTLPGRSAAPWHERLRATLPPMTGVRSDDGGLPYGRVLRVLRSCAAPGAPVAIYPFAPQLAAFSGRQHAGPYLVLVPGYFDDEAGQDRAMAQLLRDDPALVLWDERFMFDGRPERAPVRTHARLHAAVMAAFERQGTIDGFTVYANRKARGAVAFIAREGRCL